MMSTRNSILLQVKAENHKGNAQEEYATHRGI